MFGYSVGTVGRRSVVFPHKGASRIILDAATRFWRDVSVHLATGPVYTDPDFLWHHCCVDQRQLLVFGICEDPRLRLASSTIGNGRTVRTANSETLNPATD